jgi:purine-binding chemotaxis protein CheW
MDLRKRFGEREVRRDKKNRILVVEVDSKLVGLIVQSASEVIKIAPSEIEAPASLLQEGEMGFVTGVGKLNGRLIILVDLRKLLQKGEWKRLEETPEPALSTG